ncbi:hypothetical protein GCK32_005057 [Trichostrongylus colubriformis]|uniref:Nematode cuticle collagen N-terminal domain-containing protein n=1 Tax=Trichostrongylus colubriformis TaxID=6319 RepID=A0AAN8FB83_TRICO
MKAPRPSGSNPPHEEGFFEAREEAYKFIIAVSGSLSVLSLLTICLVVPSMYNFVDNIGRFGKLDFAYCESAVTDMEQEMISIRESFRQKAGNRSTRAAGYGHAYNPSMFASDSPQFQECPGTPGTCVCQDTEVVMADVNGKIPAPREEPYVTKEEPTTTPSLQELYAIAADNWVATRMTPPIVVQETRDQEDTIVESSTKTVKEIEQKHQEEAERRDSNGNIIKEKPEKDESIANRLWTVVLTVLNKRPKFRPNGRKATYSFEDCSSDKKEKVKRYWWWPTKNVKGRERRLSAVIAHNIEPKEKDIPVRYRSADCL